MELYRCTGRSSGARKAYAAARFEAQRRSVPMLVIRKLGPDDAFAVIAESDSVPAGFNVSGIVEPDGNTIPA